MLLRFKKIAKDISLSSHYVAQLGSLYLDEEMLSCYSENTFEYSQVAIWKDNSNWWLDFVEYDDLCVQCKSLKAAKQVAQEMAECLLECHQEIIAMEDSNEL